MATIPGVVYVPDFLAEHEPLLHWAIAKVPWDERIRARKTASYGLPYNYAGLDYTEQPFPAELEPLRRRATDYLAVEANNCLLNYYPDGHSRMGWHFDRTIGTRGGVVIISLGLQRNLRFRRIAQLDERLDYSLAPGSLLYLPAEVHLEWHHALPRCSKREPRVSVTFRSLIEGFEQPPVGPKLSEA